MPVGTHHYMGLTEMDECEHDPDIKSLSAVEMYKEKKKIATGNR